MTSAVMTSFTDQARGPGQASRSGASDETGASGRLGWVLDPLRIMLVVLTLINISRVHNAIPGSAKFRPGLLLVVAAAAYAYMNAKALTRANVLKYWPMRRIAMLAIVAVASTAFGIALGKSATFIIDNYSKTLLYCFLITLAIRHVRDLYTFVWALALSSGILSFLALFVFRLTKSEFSQTARVENLYAYDANDVCVVLLVGLASALLLLNVTRGWQKNLLLLIVVGIGASIARTGSRGGFLGLIAFGGAALLMLSSVTPLRRMMILASVVIGMAIFSPPGYMNQMKTILNPKGDYNTTTENGRKRLIERGLHYMAEYPVFGVGIHAFSMAECTFALSGIKTGAGGTRCGAPHNSYIEAGSETGAVGLLVWVSMVWGGIWTMYRLSKRLPRAWRRGTQTERFLYAAPSHFAVGMVGFAVSSFFVSFAWIDIVYLQVALISGLYLSVAVYTASPTVAAGPVAPRRGGPGWRVKESAQRRLAAAPRVLQLPAAR